MLWYHTWLLIVILFGIIKTKVLCQKLELSSVPFLHRERTWGPEEIL